jgi:hypothetical protein
MSFQRHLVVVPFRFVVTTAALVPARLSDLPAGWHAPVRFCRAAGDFGEAEMFVLLPVPVCRQPAQAPEARFALAQARLRRGPLRFPLEGVERKRQHGRDAFQHLDKLCVEESDLGRVHREGPDDFAILAQRKRCR